MDDALYLEADDSGWQLKVAIADPSRYIAPGTPLEEAARQRAGTVYMLGHIITLLPAALAPDTFSLVPAQQRPVLVCTMHLDRGGGLGAFRFNEGVLRSHHQL